MVVAQLAEWSLPIQEVRGSNLVIGKFLFRAFIYFNCIEKTKTKKEKRLLMTLKSCDIIIEFPHCCSIAQSDNF